MRVLLTKVTVMRLLQYTTKVPYCKLVKFKQCMYSNKLIDSYIYILVAGLEALCAVRRKVQTVLFTGFRKKVNVVLGIR